MAFHLALLGAAVLLVCCHFLFTIRSGLVVVINTLIILLIGLPVADHLLAPTNQLRATRARAARFLSYREAEANPLAFAQWWIYYVEQWQGLEKQILTNSADGYLPFRLIPNSSGTLVQSGIRINSFGFRGRELSVGKPRGSYRVIVLGESSSFGVTLNEVDRPWPERLEMLIQQELGLTNVEVINAAAPGYRLDHQLHRLPELLRLQPDMLIAYHGFNGFPMLNSALPQVIGPRPPAYVPRPLWLLANTEYRLKLIHYKRKHREPKTDAHAAADPMTTGYAQVYRNLIEAARTNRLKLVLGNFSLAVNAGSSAEAIEFYQAGFPSVERLSGQTNCIPAF
jgi:hypothetical protein